jgi:hypothetical protein
MGHKASMFKSFEIDLKFGIFFFGGGDLPLSSYSGSIASAFSQQSCECRIRFG